MSIINKIFEGDASSPGLNFIRISDGAFALLWLGKAYAVYARVRGRSSHARPRVYGHIEKIPAHARPF